MVQLLPAEHEHLSLPLSSLLRLDTQIPAGAVAIRPLNAAHVQQLAASEMSRWPAILVVRCEKGYIVIDGNHRWKAAQRKQATTIQARCQSFADEREVIDAAFRANLGHGLQASPSTRGAYACWLHATFPTLSQEKIAVLACLTQGAVSKALAKQAARQQADREPDGALLAKRATRRFLHAAQQFVQEVAQISDEELRQLLSAEDRATLSRLVRLLGPTMPGDGMLRLRQFLPPRS